MHDTDDNPHHPCVGRDARVHRLVLKKMVNANPMRSDNVKCESDKPFSTEGGTTSIKRLDVVARSHLQNLVSIASMCEAAQSHHWLAPVRTWVSQTGTFGAGSKLLGRHEGREDHSAKGRADYTWDRMDCTVESPCG